jgi:hypothetical protein
MCYSTLATHKERYLSIGVWYDGIVLQGRYWVSAK